MEGKDIWSSRSFYEQHSQQILIKDGLSKRNSTNNDIAINTLHAVLTFKRAAKIGKMITCNVLGGTKFTLGAFKIGVQDNPQTIRLIHIRPIKGKQSPSKIQEQNCGEDFVMHTEIRLLVPRVTDGGCQQFNFLSQQ